MPRKSILLVLAVAIVAIAGGLLMTAGREPSTSAAPAGVKPRLEAIASSTVLFGHQSVGSNVLEGLGALAREEGVPLRIAEVRTAAELRPGTFGHVFVATNGDPLRKLGSFGAALEGADPDVALVKFCFVDLDANADARALFTEYQATLRALQAKHPRTTFVHVTVPLVADEGFVKSIAKRILGKSSRAVPANAKREEFNALLRDAYRDAPLFDLARIESLDSSGRPVAAKLDGRVVPMLAREYTDDGGHLNEAGRWRAAVALVDVLGDALLARTAAGAGDERVRAP